VGILYLISCGKLGVSQLSQELLIAIFVVHILIGKPVVAVVELSSHEREDELEIFRFLEIEHQAFQRITLSTSGFTDE
jgi:hypothetical protein